jgi:hypothetical protein
MRTSTPRSRWSRAFCEWPVLAHWAIGFALGWFLIGGMLPARTVHATEVTATSQHLLTAASANNAAVVIGPGFMPRCRETAIYIVWGAGVGSGGVTIESAHDPNYTGTWAPLAVVAWTAASKEDIIQITGVHDAIRTRISTVIGGGTIDSYAVCN